jgi:hypothetical protein
LEKPLVLSLCILYDIRERLKLRLFNIPSSPFPLLCPDSYRDGNDNKLLLTLSLWVKDGRGHVIFLSAGG